MCWSNTSHIQYSRDYQRYPFDFTGLLRGDRSQHVRLRAVAVALQLKREG